MKISKYVFFIMSFLMFFSSHVYAVYCTRLYIPNNQVIYDFGNIRLGPGESVTEKEFSFHYIGTGVTSAANGNNSGPAVRGKNAKRYWMAYHYGAMVINGLSVVISGHPDTFQGKYALTKTDYTYGYSGIIPSSCNTSLGQPYWFLGDLPIVNGIRLTVSRNGVFPGHYDISIPFAFGVQENEYTDSPGPSPSNFLSTLLRGINTHSIKGSVDVISSCRFIESQINFNFGDVSLSDALSGVKKKSSFNISCTDPTRVKLSIEGGDQGPNRTTCGSGVCSIPIGVNGAASTITTVSPSRYWELEALFKTDKAFSGEFNGSLVLSMEIV